VQEALENNNVLDEILAMLADHENRIKALEPKESDEDDEILAMLEDHENRIKALEPKEPSKDEGIIDEEGGDIE